MNELLAGCLIIAIPFVAITGIYIVIEGAVMATRSIPELVKEKK